MYPISNLKTIDQCRIVMKRALEQGKKDIYESVFKRLCEIEGKDNDDPSDPLIADFYKTLAAYEQLLTEKNNRTTKATRTRQKISNKGVHQSLIEWTRGKTETNGFQLLVTKGFSELTGEYLVVKYSDRFPSDVVELAKARLSEHNIIAPTDSASLAPN